jgi:hypothetical protein
MLTTYIHVRGSDTVVACKEHVEVSYGGRN